MRNGAELLRNVPFRMLKCGTEKMILIFIHALCIVDPSVTTWCVYIDGWMFVVSA